MKDHWVDLYRTEPQQWDIEMSYLAERGGVPVSDSPRVMIATPAYTGLEIRYIESRDKTVLELNAHGVTVDILTTAGDSLVTRGRHTIMHQFLASAATHLLFWDSDIEVCEPDAVCAMLQTGKDVIGGAYPFRDGSGRVVANPRLEDAARGKLDIEHHDVGDLIPVSEVGTGFLLISRKAIVSMCHAFPTRLYRSDLPEFMGEPMWALFDTSIENGRYLSEDYFFCARWRELGGAVYVYAPATFRHWGKKGYEGNIREAWQMRDKVSP